jgi:hypothetical protein
VELNNIFGKRYEHEQEDFVDSALLRPAAGLGRLRRQ